MLNMFSSPVRAIPEKQEILAEIAKAQHYLNTGLFFIVEGDILGNNWEEDANEGRKAAIFLQLLQTFNRSCAALD